MSKSYRAIFLHMIFQIRKNHPFFLTLRKQRNIFVEKFQFFLSFLFLSFFFFSTIINVKSRFRSDPISCNFFPKNRTTSLNEAALDVFDRTSVSLKARDQPTQLAHFQLSFADFGREDVARGSLDLVCTFPVQTGSDVAEISLAPTRASSDTDRGSYVAQTRF